MSDDNAMDTEQTGGGRRYVARPKICQFCADKNLTIDYKQIDMLRRFVSDDGKIRKSDRSHVVL